MFKVLYVNLNSGTSYVNIYITWAVQHHNYNLLFQQPLLGCGGDGGTSATKFQLLSPIHNNEL